ncbi:MAG: type IV pilus assembly protein PilM [Hydrogenophaga sp.]
MALASWFGRMPEPLLGVDVGSSSIKLVELGRRRDGRLVLERRALEPLARGWMVDGNVEQFDEVAQALRRAVRASGTRTRNAAMALPLASVITRTIVMPGDRSDTEQVAHVWSEAERYLPFALDEASLDFAVLGPASAPGGNVDVTIVASREEKVSDRQGLAEVAGLQAVIMDVDACASRRVAGRMISTPSAGPAQALVALFDIGMQRSCLQVFRHETLLHEREHGFGGVHMTQLIVERWGVSAHEADAMTDRVALPDESLGAVYEAFNEHMAQEMARALQVFFASTPYNRVDHVLLAGASAAVPGLAAWVGQRAQCHCQVVHPFEGMALSAHVQGLGIVQNTSAFVTATGLAMRRFCQ